MTTSGTTAFNMDLVELAEEAGERAGYEIRSGYELRTARRSLNLMFSEWANAGINLWTVEQGEVPLVAGTAVYSLPTDTVDLLDHTIRQTTGASQTDITITRISVSTYASIPNMLSQSRPLQVYINRLAPIPTITVWPIPSDGSYTFVYWRLRRIQDAGNGVNTMDVPFRFLPAMVAGLAYFLAVKNPSSFDRIPMLKQMYDDAWSLAAAEDSDRSAIRFVPRVARI